MANSIRYVGNWWVPGTPNDKRYGGTLEIDEEGTPILEVAGELVGNGEAEIIYGLAAGKQITLTNVFRVDGQTVMNQVMTVVEVLRAQLAFVGAHLPEEKSEVFNEVEVEIAGLSIWTGYTGLHRRIVSDPETRHFQKAEFSFTIPNEITATIDRLGQKLTISWSATSGMDELIAGHEMRVLETAKLKVRAKSLSAWAEFEQAIHGVQNLVTLATRKPCAVRARKLFVPDGNSEDSRPWPVDLFYSSSEKWEDGKLQRHRLLFHLTDLGGDHEVVLNAWFELIAKIGLPLDVLFALDYSPPSYYENELFNAASAAEGFHAAFFRDSTALDPEEHKGISNAVAEAFSDHPQIQWIKSKVNDNRPGLKQRLLELASLVDPEVSSLLVGDVDTWAKWLRNGRNAIGHLNTGELERSIKDEDARYRLAYVTQALLHLIILEKLGLTKDRQIRIINDIYGYSSRRFKLAIHDHLSR